MARELALCGDIGGTTDDLDIARFTEKGMKAEFVKHEHTPDSSQFIGRLNKYLQNAKEEKGLEPKIACFAVAGPVKNRKVELSNAPLTIDANEIEEKTPLNHVMLINDFSAIGYAVNVLEESDVKILQEGEEIPRTNGAVVGAGTGLGKSILVHSQQKNAYLPYPSEGGHTDLPLFNEEDFKIAEYIREERNISRLSYEEVLSGRGIEILYEYYRQKEYLDSAENLSADQIANTKGRNPCSNEAFDKFMEFYARCVRNFALETYSTGGMYISGGIAAKNPELFDRDFIQKFRDTPYSRFKQILEGIPVKLITNQNVGLKGAAEALKVKGAVD